MKNPLFGIHKFSSNLFDLFIAIATVNLVCCQNCTPFAVHISLATYYQNFGPNQTYSLSSALNITSFENQTAIVQFQTIDNCTELRMATLINNTNFTVLDGLPYIESYVFLQADGEANQTKYIYNYTLTLDTTNVGQLFNYSIVNIDEQNNYVIMNNFSSRLPVRDLADNVVNYTQKFLFVGMMDISNQSQNTFTKLQELAMNASQNQSSVDLIIYLGDMAFSLNDNDYAKGDTFLNSVETFATFIPFMTTAGDTESYDGFQFYQTMFQMTSNQKNGIFYSFNVGNVHFIQINMAYFFLANSTYQKVLLGYLTDDLKIATTTENRMTRPWIFVYGFNSLYCGLAEDTTCEKLMQTKNLAAFETLLYLNKVDIFFSSYYPLYQRSKPLYQNKPMKYDNIYVLDQNQNNYSAIFNPEGVLYIVEGAGGNNLANPESQTLSENFLISLDTIGYGLLTLINKTHIFYEHIDSETGLPVDQFYLINELLKWNELWTPAQEYWFTVCSVVFVFMGIIVIGIFQIYVDRVM